MTTASGIKARKIDQWVLAGELRDALKSAGLPAWRHGAFVDTTVAGVDYELTFTAEGPRAVDAIPEPAAQVMRAVWGEYVARVLRDRADMLAIHRAFQDAIWDVDHAPGSPRVEAA